MRHEGKRKGMMMYLDGEEKNKGKDARKMKGHREKEELLIGEANLETKIRVEKKRKVFPSYKFLEAFEDRKNSLI